MKLHVGSAQTEVLWGGVSRLDYTAILRSGNRVVANFICLHNEDESSGDQVLEIQAALTFHPHGWVRFGRSTLVLNRHDVLRYNLPLDIVEESMFHSKVSTADIENIYGKRIRDDQGEPVQWVQARKRPAKPVASFSRMRVEGIMKEQQQIEADLEPAWKERVFALAASLLRHPQRTRQILRKWHERPMLKDRRPDEIYAAFIGIVLYNPCHLHIRQDSLHFFEDPALAIPLGWLNADERIIVTDMVINRRLLFRHVNEGIGHTYSCKGFRMDSFLGKAICRRFIVHQFVSDCVERATVKGRERPELLLTMIEVIGRCYVNDKRSDFLYYLKRSLEQCTVVQDVMHLPMYVSIGDAVPAYAYTPPDRSRPHRQPCWTPK